jgi:tRNA-dihydrouridine synthase B
MRIQRPLCIGSIELPHPVILAPMAGITDRPFRRLVQKLGGGLVVSEMIASQAMIRQTRQSLRMATQTLEDYPMAVQLAGCDPCVMAEAAKLNEDLGVTVIDINMGCPVKKVVNGDAGAALMKDERLAARILESVVKSVSIPVTLKMRTGWDAEHRNAPTLARIAEQVGIQMITVHGRTRAQLYTGRADWAMIRQVKESVHIPVVGNGDLTNLDAVKQAMDMSGVDGVMIGRGTYGQPWMIGQIAQSLQTQSIVPGPSIAEQKLIVFEHLDAMLDHYGSESGCLIARKHLAWYSRGFSNAAAFRAQLNQTQSTQALIALLHEFFGHASEAVVESNACSLDSLEEASSKNAF